MEDEKNKIVTNPEESDIVENGSTDTGGEATTTPAEPSDDDERELTPPTEATTKPLTFAEMYAKYYLGANRKEIKDWSFDLSNDTIFDKLKDMWTTLSGSIKTLIFVAVVCIVVGIILKVFFRASEVYLKASTGI